MEKYKVTGMSCSACSARVEKTVSELEGVNTCSVNLLTGTMTIEGEIESSTVIKAVEGAGYGAMIDSDKTKGLAKKVSGEEKNEHTLVLRLISSVIFLAMLMYISMGYVMWNWPIPEIISKNPFNIGLLELMLSSVVIVINQKFFINGVKGIIHKAPNMDTLVSLGSLAAYVYSISVLFLISDNMYNGDIESAMHCVHELYFESAAMILTLITVGKMLESRAKGKTTDALESLMKLSPKNTTVIRNGKEMTIPVENVVQGDIFIVRPGENIPVDGIVIEGHSAVDEAALTGESIPIDKIIGDDVSSGTLNQSGVLKCNATRVGEDTTLAQIIRMVNDAAATKAPISKVADKVSGIFVPTIIIIALVTTIIWLLAGKTVGFALARGISVLVISCPCALGLATPVAIMVGTGMGAKNKILYKTAAALEMSGRIQTVAIDKTGTITSGHPKVTDIIPAFGITEEKLISYANSLEKDSEHPLAKAIINEANERNILPENVTDFKILPGSGLVAKLNGEELMGGNFKFMREKINISQDIEEVYEKLANEGKTPLFFSVSQKFIGIIAVSDTIKEDSAKAIKELKNMGINVVMLTGDNEKTARSIGSKIDVDEVISGVLPQGKEEVIRNLQKNGKVAMVGDGINDAPALSRADVGIAIGVGTDIAIDSADVVLVRSNLLDVAAAIRLGRATLRNIHQNLFWAFFYNSLGIPLAAGLFIPLFGITLNPMFGAAAMSLSSFCVVMNALRLNFVKVNAGLNEEKSNKTKLNKKENEKMKKIMKIEGMMCPHCEASVKKTLENLGGVKEAVVNHKEGSAIISFSEDISNDLLKKAVEESDYKVLSIEDYKG